MPALLPHPAMLFTTICAGLNHLYLTHPACFEMDYDENGFTWLDCHQEERCIYAFLRRSKDECLAVILNLSDQTQGDYRLGDRLCRSGMSGRARTPAAHRLGILWRFHTGNCCDLEKRAGKSSVDSPALFRHFSFFVNFIISHHRTDGSSHTPRQIQGSVPPVRSAAAGCLLPRGCRTHVQSLPRGISLRIENSGPSSFSIRKYSLCTLTLAGERPADAPITSGRGTRLSKGLRVCPRISLRAGRKVLPPGGQHPTVIFRPQTGADPLTLPWSVPASGKDYISGVRPCDTFPLPGKTRWFPKARPLTGSPGQAPHRKERYQKDWLPFQALPESGRQNWRSAGMDPAWRPASS